MSRSREQLEEDIFYLYVQGGMDGAGHFDCIGFKDAPDLPSDGVILPIAKEIKERGLDLLVGCTYEVEGECETGIRIIDLDME